MAQFLQSQERSGFDHQHNPGILTLLKFLVVTLAALHGRFCFMYHPRHLKPSEYGGSPQGNYRGLTSYK
jgi:hypothetical protein